MRSQVSRFKVGLFVIICGGIVLGGLVWAGAVGFLKNRKTYVAFFDGSVKGVGPGASVDYLGVDVGEVRAVDIAPDGRHIEMRLALEPSFPVDDETVVSMAKAGITGGAYIAVSRTGKPVPKPKLTFPVKAPIIPVSGSGAPGLAGAVQQAVGKFKELDFSGTLSEMKKTVADADAVLVSLKGALGSGNLKETVANLRDSSAKLDELVAALGQKGLPDRIERTAADISRAAEEARRAGSSLAGALSSMPRGSIGRLTTRLSAAAGEGKKAMTRLDQHVERLTALLAENSFRMNRLIDEIGGLVKSLGRDPGRVLDQPRNSEPFHQ